MSELKKLLCSSQTHFLGNLLYEKRFRRLVVLVLIMDSVWITIKEIESPVQLLTTLEQLTRHEADELLVEISHIDRISKKIRV